MFGARGEGRDDGSLRGALPSATAMLRSQRS
jgi:hypothetical protein